MTGRCKVAIVCGGIGHGKTTLSRELAGALGDGTLWLTEPDETSGNPYLADYYEDPARWAYTMQTHLLSRRFRMHKLAQWYAMEGRGNAVLDSSYWQDTCFARLQVKSGFMSAREFESYAALYHAMTASVLLPSVCVRTLVSPDVALHRIRTRMEKQTGRKCEVAVTREYLEGLEREIDHMVATLEDRGVPTLYVSWDEDRDTPDARRDAVAGLASRILARAPLDPFLDLHRRTT